LARFSSKKQKHRRTWSGQATGDRPSAARYKAMRATQFRRAMDYAARHRSHRQTSTHSHADTTTAFPALLGPYCNRGCDSRDTPSTETVSKIGIAGGVRNQAARALVFPQVVYRLRLPGEFLHMDNLRDLEAEERALVTYARLSMDLYALTHSERTHAVAHEALSRAELLRREAERLRRQERVAADA